MVTRRINTEPLICNSRLTMLLIGHWSFRITGDNNSSLPLEASGLYDETQCIWLMNDSYVPRKFRTALTHLSISDLRVFK